MAFATTCNRCKNEYYGNSCPYCAGYSAGISDAYNGSNTSRNTCNPYNNSKTYESYNKSKGNSPKSNVTAQQQSENTANCWQGYNDARKSASGTEASSATNSSN